MEKMQDQNCDQDFVEVYNVPRSQDDVHFDQIITQMQEIVIDPGFENTLTNFMKNHWAVFDGTNKQAELKVFNQYREVLQKYLQQRITQKVPDFNWKRFGELFQSRKKLVDEQLLDTLDSLNEVQNFKMFIKDYKHSYQEEEILHTIKTNKMPANKKVKGKDNNIFAGGNTGTGGDLFDKGLKMPVQKKQMVPQKTQEELLVPELILTVKPMRKA